MDDKRRELIDALINLVTPAPLRVHREILFNLSLLFGVALADKPCEVYVAPFDVRLPNNPDEISDEQVYTVV